MTNRYHVAPARSIAAALVLWAALATAALAQRLPEPDPREVREAVKRLQETHAREYQSRDRAVRRALAEKLLESADAPETTPPMRYAAFTEARDLAVSVGEVRGALRATRRLVGEFDVNDATATQATLEALEKTAREPREAAELSLAYADLVEKLVLADQYARARELADTAGTVARRSRDRDLAAGLKRMRDWVKDIEAAYVPVRNVVLSASSPSGSPEDQRQAGEFLCLFKGQWKEGLPLLARGDDERRRDLASRDLDRPLEPARRVELGDGWWELASTGTPLQRAHAQSRAAFWYGLALHQLEGTAREGVRARLETVRAERDDFIPNLLGNHALRLDGSGHVIVESFRFDGGHPLTVEAFVTPSRLPLDKATLVGNKRRSGFALTIERGGYWFFVFHGQDDYHFARSDELVEVDKRIHIAGVFDGKSVRLYLDGVLQKIGANVVGQHTASPNPLIVGGDPGGGGGVEDHLEGLVDDVRITRRALYKSNFRPPSRLERDRDTLLMLHCDEADGEGVADFSQHEAHGSASGVERERVR